MRLPTPHVRSTRSRKMTESIKTLLFCCLGATGVGTRITLGDGQGQPVADFIVGKEVTGRPGLRYVRRAEKDQVYSVKLDTQYLSNRFEDWIERNLLKIDPLDLKQVVLADY